MLLGITIVIILMLIETIHILSVPTENIYVSVLDWLFYIRCSIIIRGLRSNIYIYMNGFI